MDFLEQLKAMSVGDLIAQIVLVIGVISVIIEKSKKLPFNPWTTLFNWIGNKMTESIAKRFDSFEKQQNEKDEFLERQNNETRELIISIRTDYQDSIKTVQEDYNKRIDKLERDMDEKEVKRLRSNIICFADACRTGNTRYTKQHFENIFRDYDDYLAYCKRNNFTNHFIDGEIEFIKIAYAKFCSGATV